MLLESRANLVISVTPANIPPTTPIASPDVSNISIIPLFPLLSLLNYILFGTFYLLFYK
jgi:hypothetical protein